MKEGQLTWEVGRDPGWSKKSSQVCHVFYGQVHTTHRKQGQAITPTPTLQPTRGLHCFSNWQAIFFHVGILPLTTTSIFLTNPAGVVHWHAHTHWGFLKLSVLRWWNTTAFGLRCICISGPICPIMCSKHWSNLLTSNLPQNIPPAKALSSFTVRFFQPNRLWLLFTKLTTLTYSFLHDK